MYGIQTYSCSCGVNFMFENDVKMYGIQTALYDDTETVTFENDVKMYGIQTRTVKSKIMKGLRMM